MVERHFNQAQHWPCLFHAFFSVLMRAQFGVCVRCTWSARRCAHAAFIEPKTKTKIQDQFCNFVFPMLSSHLSLLLFCCWIFGIPCRRRTYRNEKGSSVLKLKWCRDVAESPNKPRDLYTVQAVYERMLCVWDAVGVVVVQRSIPLLLLLLLPVIRLFISISLFALLSYSYPRKRGITIKARSSFFLSLSLSLTHLHSFSLSGFTSKINKPTHTSFGSMQSIRTEQRMGRLRQTKYTHTHTNTPMHNIRDQKKKSWHLAHKMESLSSSSSTMNEVDGGAAGGERREKERKRKEEYEQRKHRECKTGLYLSLWRFLLHSIKYYHRRLDVAFSPAPSSSSLLLLLLVFLQKLVSRFHYYCEHRRMPVSAFINSKKRRGCMAAHTLRYMHDIRPNKRMHNEFCVFMRSVWLARICCVRLQVFRQSMHIIATVMERSQAEKSATRHFQLNRMLLHRIVYNTHRL